MNGSPVRFAAARAGGLQPRAALGDVLAKEYLVVKRSEARGFEGQGLAFEIKQHFYKY